MTDETQPKPADKVWAMYDGPNFPDYITRGKWYEVEECNNGKDFRAFGGLCCWKFGPWQRHVGPTPPDAKESAMQELADLGQAFDADGWIPHDGSAKRPKGVGKRDEVEYFVKTRKTPSTFFAGQLDWSYIHSYRITARAPKKEKRRKVWVVVRDGEKAGAYFFDESDAVKFSRGGGTLYTAKLTPVKDGK